MRRLAAVAAALALAACSRGDPLPPEAGEGPDPRLPAIQFPLISPIKLSPPLGWANGRTPKPAPGLAVKAFASGLEHPRWLHVLPNGDVLVAETDGGGEVKKRPKDFVMGWAMHRVHAELPRNDRIELLRDGDGDGVAETRTTFIPGLNSAFGMALVGDALYVANTDAILRFPYSAGVTSIPRSAGVEVAKLPAGAINHHWTKSLVANRDGSRLYVGVGANSNVAENGMDNEVHRAAVLEVDPATGRVRDYATGIRNPVGMDWEPATGALWAVVNERDEIGDDLPPDYLTSVRPGGFYGWPWSYWGGHVDRRAWPPRPDMVARAIRPDYGLGSHGGQLGLTFADGAALGPRFASGAFIGQHGSWNRSRRNGYRVIFVPFANGRPSGMPIPVLTGFLAPSGNSYGRPVGVEIDKTGALRVADDAGRVVWRVTAASPTLRATAPQPGGRRL
jgi:glucose/arabinose dehydrogenase